MLKQTQMFGIIPRPMAGSCKFVLDGQGPGRRLRCRPLLVLAPADTLYLPFDAARDGYPFLSPTS